MISEGAPSRSVGRHDANSNRQRWMRSFCLPLPSTRDWIQLTISVVLSPGYSTPSGAIGPSLFREYHVSLITNVVSPQILTARWTISLNIPASVEDDISASSVNFLLSAGLQYALTSSLKNHNPTHLARSLSPKA